MNTGSRPSACPGLLRIVAAKDGGLCRIKLPGGLLDAAQAHAIADACTRHAAGAIELTNRANLQVRGVRDGQEAALIEALLAAGLGPTTVAAAMNPTDIPDARTTAADVAAVGQAGEVAEPAGPRGSHAAPSTPDLCTVRAIAADDVRNVMISPTAGRDPSALFDTTPLCTELLTLLQSEPRFAALSPKFALLLDGGERLARIDHPHDVWFAATQGDDGVRFVFGLAGCPPEALPSQAAHASKLGTQGIALAAVLPEQILALIRALLHTFLDLAPADATRMRDLLATHSVDAVLSHAQRHLGHVDFPLKRDTALANWRRGNPADATRRLGAHPQRTPDRWHVGGQPPLGRLSADTLHGLAELAQRHSHGALHMTPWQSVLLPDVATDAVPEVLDGLNAKGLVTTIEHPIARLIACAGSSGCAKSLADTKADALRLAPRLPAGVEVHLSGCARSCAAAHCAPYTLLASAPGAYDLYQRDGQSGFGRCIAQRLTLDAAADMLASVPHA